MTDYTPTEDEVRVEFSTAFYFQLESDQESKDRQAQFDRFIAPYKNALEAVARVRELANYWATLQVPIVDFSDLTPTGSLIREARQAVIKVMAEELLHTIKALDGGDAE